MPQQIDTNLLKKAEAATTIAKDLIAQAIEQSAANSTLCELALKQASSDLAQAHTLVSQVQSSFQTEQPKMK